MDREGEPGDPAEAGRTWFDTPGDPSRADPETPEPTWFDGPAQRKSLTGQDRPIPVNAGFLARATAEPPEAARARARLAILSEVERRARAWAPVVMKAVERGISPEQASVRFPWEDPPAAVPEPWDAEEKERRRGGRRPGSGLAIRDREHLFAELRRIRDEQHCAPSAAEFCRLFQRRGGGSDVRGIDRTTLRTALDRLELEWDQALTEALG